MWYYDVLGFPKVPIGVFDHPADPDTPGLYSVGVGRSRAVEFGHEVTSGINELGDLLHSIKP